MKKIWFIGLITAMVLGTFSGCSTEDEGDFTPTPLPDPSAIPSPATSPAGFKAENPVDLMVVTSYGASDGNRQDFEDAYTDFEKVTGHTVLDSSEMSSEAWKTKVRMDFQTGAEPDVLFFYSGSDADLLVETEKVVSLEEIREVYPNYGSNMMEEMIPVSTYDGKQYVIPVNGYWEGLYVNLLVLEEVGITLPEEGYTMTQFLEDCALIKEAGYVPIAAAMGEEPHYWFETAVFNNGTMENHMNIPTSGTDSTALKWMAALDDLKELYEAGYFPEDTLTATSLEVSQLMVENQAAFQIQGSWHMNWLKSEGYGNDFVVTYLPYKGYRGPNEVIGGISMGYYITRRGWEDPQHQEAAVNFVSAMTTAQVVSNFGATSLTALKSQVLVPPGLSQLELSAIYMNEDVTGVVEAVQDQLEAEVRTELFEEIALVLTGQKTSEEVVKQSLGLD